MRLFARTRCPRPPVRESFCRVSLPSHSPLGALASPVQVTAPPLTLPLVSCLVLSPQIFPSFGMHAPCTAIPMLGPARTCPRPSVHGPAVHFRLVPCSAPLQHPPPSVEVRTRRTLHSAHGPAMRSPSAFRARSHRARPGSIPVLPLFVPVYLLPALPARLPVRGPADEFPSPTYPVFFFFSFLFFCTDAFSSFSPFLSHLSSTVC